MDITGISNEPWHYRYVGTTVAKIMKEENLCLEGGTVGRSAGRTLQPKGRRARRQ